MFKTYIQKRSDHDDAPNVNDAFTQVCFSLLRSCLQETYTTRKYVNVDALIIKLIQKLYLASLKLHLQQFQS